MQNDEKYCAPELKLSHGGPLQIHNIMKDMTRTLRNGAPQTKMPKNDTCGYAVHESTAKTLILPANACEKQKKATES